jgi:hypothetical protein
MGGAVRRKLRQGFNTQLGCKSDPFRISLGITFIAGNHLPRPIGYLGIDKHRIDHGRVAIVRCAVRAAEWRVTLFRPISRLHRRVRIVEFEVLDQIGLQITDGASGLMSLPAACCELVGNISTPNARCRNYGASTWSHPLNCRSQRHRVSVLRRRKTTAHRTPMLDCSVGEPKP